MRHGSAHARWQGFWSRSVPGLVAAVCLNFAAQPCAMAMPADQGCLHCPPTGVAHAAMHHGHEAGTAAKMPCASLGKSCAQQGDASVDGRGGQAKSPDTAQPAAAAPCLSNFDLAPSQHAHRLTAPPPPVGASPPLNVLYCVYRK